MTTTICDVIPTLTSIQLIPTVVDITSFSESTISVTGNASTVTITQTCDESITTSDTGTPASVPTCIPTTRTIIMTGDVFQSVIQVSITIAEVDTQTATHTFFSTSCSVSTSRSSSPFLPTPTPTPSSNVTSTAQQDSPGFVASNGTHTPTDPTPSSSATLVAGCPDRGAGEKIGSIVGGTLGGVILLIVIVWLALHYFIRPGQFKQSSDGGSTKGHKMDLLEEDDSNYVQYGHNYQRHQDAPQIQYQQYAWDRPGNEGSDEAIEEYSSMQYMRPFSALYPASSLPSSLTSVINHHRFPDPGHASMGEYNPASHSSHTEAHSLTGQYR